MAPGDVCHGPRCSLAGLGPVALVYRSCHWPGGSPGSPQCVRPMGCWFFPVPRPPYVCAVSWATWLLFTGAPAWYVVLRVRCPGPLGSCSPVRPLGVLCCVCGVLCHLAPVHWCARRVCCVACAVSWATWLLFTGARARCVALRVRCPGPLGSCSPVCPRGLLCCVCGVLGHLAPVHGCARVVCCVLCAVSWATWLLFTSAPARCAVLCVRCPGPLGSCSPVCPPGVLCCVCGVLGHLAPVHRCARSVCCLACAVPWATWLLFTGVPARCVVLRVRFLGSLGSCSPMCPRGLWCCVCSVLGHLAPVHRCARSVCCFARCVALRARCPGPLGSFSPVRPLGVLCCVCGVLGHLAPVHRCARWVCCVVCAASWATWLLFTGAPARCVVLCVRCPGPLGSRSPDRPLGVLCCVCGVLGHLAPVHRCARSVRCVVVRCPGPLGSHSAVCPPGVLCCVCGVLGHLAPVHRCARPVCCVVCAVSWATWLLFTSVPARWVVLRVRCPGPLASRSPVCPPGVLCCVCSVLGHLAPVHPCARSVCCFACAVSWASWLLFTGVLARCVVLRVRCPGSLGSCSPVCPRGLLCCVCGVLGHLAPVHGCASVVCCVVCAVSWATWLLFTSAPARFAVLCVRCPGPLGFCSPLCPPGVLCCVCGVLGHLAPVHRCARSVCCLACAVPWATWLLFTGVSPGVLCCVCGFSGPLALVHRCARVVCGVVCAVSWATWLLFTGVPVRCVALLGVLLCVRGVLGHLAPFHWCARSVCCVVCAVSWATWLPFTGVPAGCVVLCVRRPGPLGSCSPVRPLGVLCCVCGVLGHLAPVHRCARWVCCVVCAASWATWLLFTGAPARCVVLSCGVLGHLAPIQRYARQVCCVACAVSWATWLPFTGAPAQCVVLCVRCPGPLGSSSPVCPLGGLCCVCGVLGHLAPVHRCARRVFCVACAVSWATWLLFTRARARCVALRVRCPWPLGSCSPVCPLGVLCCVCGVLGHLAPVHRCARVVCCVVCAVSWATWLLFTGAPVWYVVLCVRCPGPLGSCSPVRPLGVLCCVCGVLGHLAPVHRCARRVCCVACAVSWATWLLFTGAPARCVAWRVRCPGPLGSCSPVCPPGVLCCVCGFSGLLALVHRCARVVCGVVCAVSWATWLLFTGVPVRCVALLVVLCCVCGVLGHLAPVHRCARWVCCVVCAASWATWLLFTGAPARCVVLCVRCPGPLGSRSPVCPLGVMCCVCGVLGHLAPVHRCARSVRCVVVRCPGPLGSHSAVCPPGVLCCVCGVLGHLAPVHWCARPVCCVVCAVSWATWLLFTGVPARWVVLGVRCPGPLGSCSPVRPLGALCCRAVSWATWLLFTSAPARCVVLSCGVLGHLAPVHRCARFVLCFACAVSWATWLLFTGVPARCVVLRVRCPGLPGSCSPVRPLGVLCCVCGVLCHLAPVHRCARRVCCVACAVSWATWLLFTGAPARCVALRVRCPGPLGSCSPVCPLGVLCCVCGVLGHLAPVHRCARVVCCVVCAVSWATWLLFTGAPAWYVVLCVRCPGPLGSCSPVRPLGVLCCVCGVLGHLAPVHRCARRVCCVACAVSWATWLLFTGVPAGCVVLRVRCPGPLGSCSPVRPLGVLLCVCGALGH